MEPLPRVINAVYVDGHRIQLEFSDGLAGTVDFSAWLDGPVFEPLKSAEFFARFFLDGGTVSWPNGADVAPETLHERVKADHAA
ncbi:MAG: DUF2442 domain-containing protein [Chloroflexota bacterium]